MKWSDIFKMGVSNLLRRKTRTLLTVLGVVIGAASIIVMVSIGIGLKMSMRSQLGDSSSVTIIQVGVKGTNDTAAKTSSKKKPSLNAAAVADFKSMEDVVAVTPQKSALVHFISGRYAADVNLHGIDVTQMDKFGFTLLEGSLIKPGSDGIVFGYNATYNFYNPRRGTWKEADETKPPPVNVMNDNVKMTFDLAYEEKRRGDSGGSKARIYKVNPVGITTKESGYSWDSYMDIAVLTKLIKESDRSLGKPPQRKEKYDGIMVKVNKLENVLVVQEKIKAMGYKATSNAEYVKALESSFNTLQMALGGIGAISLLVAAIGITNTMIMSIYERTREIGVMKVVGAAITDIRALFLLEAGLIGLSGGIIGTGLSYGASYLLNVATAKSGEFSANISYIPPWLVLAALGVSMIVGLLSGYLPARRAMNLSALQAIKTE